MASYTTVQGDTWDIVSLKQYGTEKCMSDLIEANPAQRETVIFPAGISLVIPSLTASSLPKNLPPWKTEDD
jgi:phage tail protein X